MQNGAMADVRALLLTDVVDSTRIAETIGDSRAAQLWAAHDRCARDLLPRWRGREIDKTDGMLLLFDAATLTSSLRMMDCKTKMSTTSKKV